MNQLANRGAAATAIASLSQLKTGLQNVSSTIVTPGGMPILRLLKDGSWVYGAENVEVEDGSLWAVNPYSLQHGWVSWTDKPGNQPNEIVGEVMVPMTSPLPVASELRDTGWEWSQQLSVELQCVSGEDKGTTVQYKVTSVGGMNAIKALIASLMKQLDTDADRPVPVCSLDHDTYMHKRHGKVYVPVINVQKWVELTADAPVDDEPEKTPEPAKPARQRQSVPQTRRAAPAAQQTRAAPEKYPDTEVVYDDAVDEVAVQPTAADRKAALLAELARMESGDVEDAETEEAPEAPAPDAPRRRRRA